VIDTTSCKRRLVPTRHIVADLISPRYGKLLTALKMRDTEAMAPRLQSGNRRRQTDRFSGCGGGFQVQRQEQSV
jgi:hypothetical protein